MLFNLNSQTLIINILHVPHIIYDWVMILVMILKGIMIKKGIYTLPFFLVPFPKFTF